MRYTDPSRAASPSRRSAEQLFRVTHKEIFLTRSPRSSSSLICGTSIFELPAAHCGVGNADMTMRGTDTASCNVRSHSAGLVKLLSRLCSDGGRLAQPPSLIPSLLHHAMTLVSPTPRLPTASVPYYISLHSAHFFSSPSCSSQNTVVAKSCMKRNHLACIDHTHLDTDYRGPSRSR